MRFRRIPAGTCLVRLACLPNFECIRCARIVTGDAMVVGKGIPGRRASYSGSSRATGDEQLIDLIYACLVGESSWRDFLVRLAKALPGGMSTLFYHDVSTGAGSWQINHGLPSEAVGKYAEYYSGLNPWMPKAAVRKIGVGVVAEQMYPRDQFVRTEFYNDYFRKFGAESAVGVTIAREEGRSFLLSTITSRPNPELNIAAAEQLSRLAPHLRRVFKHFRTHVRQETTGLECSLFDAISVGVAVIGEGGIVRSISETGVRILEKSGCGRTTILGKLRLGSERATEALDSMLNRCYDGPRVATFVIGPVRLTLILTQRDPYLAYFAGPTVAVLMETLQLDAPFDAERFLVAFSLTAAETRALSGIVSGKSIDEIAAAAGLSRETIRSQLKSLYAKTGASGQTDLVRLARSSLSKKVA